MAGVAAVQAKLLRDAGHEVDQIALSQAGAAWSWPAKAFAIPFRLAAYLPTINRLRRGHYDVVHIHWLTQGVIGLAIGQDFFVQAHGSDLHVNLNNPLLARVTRAVLERAKIVFYVTPNLRAYVRDFDGKLRFLPNPIDVSAIASSPRPPTGVVRVLIFTRLDPVKGVDRIFAAVETLSRTVDLTGMDWGPLRQDYVPRFKSFVRFVSLVPHSEVGAFLQGFDIVIGQVHQGILSLSELEAMAAGRPLVTGVDWSLYPDDPPPVVAARDPDEIVAAVNRLKADPSELERLSRLGREWVARNHGFARHLHLLEDAYFGSRPAT